MSPDQAPISATGLGQVFRSRDFRLLWGGQFVSLLGDQFFLVALPWLVLQLTGDPLAIGSVLAVSAAPRADLPSARRGPHRPVLPARRDAVLQYRPDGAGRRSGDPHLHRCGRAMDALRLRLPSRPGVCPLPAGPIGDRPPAGPRRPSADRQRHHPRAPLSWRSSSDRSRPASSSRSSVTQGTAVARVPRRRASLSSSRSTRWASSSRPITLALIASPLVRRDRKRHVVRSSVLHVAGRGPRRRLAGQDSPALFRAHRRGESRVCSARSSVGIPVLAHTRFSGGAFAYGAILSGLGAGALVGMVAAGVSSPATGSRVRGGHAWFHRAAGCRPVSAWRPSIRGAVRWRRPSSSGWRRGISSWSSSPGCRSAPPESNWAG